ncbi:SDR family oxidoreductase [Sulfitobacter sp. HNIBRBA3233]|uniref:SDR family NAD(P)-dependent oxidoreductase n=1 Tax=Sulfitobacter marinivivus TaxID=3158558 RepID=UPI0032DEEBDB
MARRPTVIVTGAGSGIGAATARRFSDEGWHVVLNGRTRDKLEKVARELPHDATLICEGDVSNPDDVKAVVAKTVETFGRIDTLVNNAGIARAGGPGELSREDWNALLAINVTGIYNMVEEALPHLERTRGSIVNVSSVSGMGGDWRFFGYNASKGAVSNMTRSMALDLGQRGIRVNAVAPSVTRSEMSEGLMKNEEKLEKIRERMPLGRPAEASEVASVIWFLSGADASMVNGVILPVDGGVSASNGQPAIIG